MASRRRITWVVGVVALVVSGWYCGQAFDDVAPVYRTEKLTRGNINEVVSAKGTLNPVKLVTVGSQVSGKVTRTYAAVNDHVMAGQLLAEIDPALLLAQMKQDNSALASANANYEQAERDLNRNRLLLEKDFVAKVVFEQARQTYLNAKNGYESAKTTIERDQLNLDYAKITSPIDGIVIERTVTEGQTLQASFQTPDLYKIAGNLAEMKIDVNFPESDIPKIKVGMPVTFTVTAFGDRIFVGTVQTVNLTPTGQSQTGGLTPTSQFQTGGVTYSVVIELHNDDNLLLPGMTANVSVILSQKSDVLRLPLSALRFNPPQEQVSGLRKLFGAVSAKALLPSHDENGRVRTVYVMHGSAPTAVRVETGVSDDEFIETSGDGIAEGDEIVVGIQKVRTE
jgi:HlyD family secretion protein